MNYGELKTAVQGWANRADLAGVLPTLLALAEQRIYNGSASESGLRLESMVVTNAAYTPGALPARFLQIVRVAWSVGTRKIPLVYRTADGISIAENTPGIGAWFSIRGGQLLLGPTITGPIELVYYAKLPALVADADTNDLLTNHPSIYLYAALVEVAVWLQDDAMAAQYGPLFADAMNKVREADETAKRGTSPLRIMPEAGRMRV